MIRGVSLAAIFVIIFLSMSAYAQQAENLVGLYLFDDGNGDEVIDLSGNENHAVLQGGVKRVDGYFKGGLDFNGSDAFVEIPDSESLALTEGLTIAMWIYLRSYSTAGGTGVTKEASYKAGTRDHRKMIIRAETAGGAWGANNIDGETEVPPEEWHHVAATYDGESGDAILYVDGAEDTGGTFGGEIVPNTNVVWIGRGNAPFFDGIYDEVAIWNVALSGDEILEAMNTLHAVTPSGRLVTTWGRMKAVY
ncbi:LamG domain-containing protein [Candidatus Poribacteria bacterium]